MLADRGHARGVEARLQRLGEHRDHVRVAVQRAIADHARLAVVHVQHGSEAEVHAVGLQLATDHEAAAARGGERLRGIAVPELAQLGHRRDGREAVAEALHAAALVVGGDQELRRAQLADRVRELDQLQRCREVAGEEDHAAHLRVLQALDVVGVELEAAHVHHHGSQPHGAFPSRTTKAMATSSSSVSEMCARTTPSDSRWRCHLGARVDQRLAARIAPHGDRMPVERRVDAGADRLGEGLLGGEALGEVAGLVARALVALALGGREDATHEALAVALEHAGHALHGTDIGADAHDHEGRFAGGAACARRDPVISAFISRTASRMPTKTARLTMAWPMCSSRTPASAAMGSTFA